MVQTTVNIFQLIPKNFNQEFSVKGKAVKLAGEEKWAANAVTSEMNVEAGSKRVTLRTIL